MCWKRKTAEYPLTDRLLTIHGQCFDILADGTGGYRRYTGGGGVAVAYHDGARWIDLGQTVIAADGLFQHTVALGYGQYRLSFHVKGRFLGGRFGPFCRWGVFDQETKVYTFRPRIEDIVQQAASPQLTGDIIVFVEGT